MSRLDPETRHALFQSPGLKRLLFYAPVLDFYGSRLCVRSGSVVLPGGDAAAQAWESLVGVSAQSPGEFVIHLLAKDQGWLAAFFDAVARVSPEQQARLAQGDRLKGLYEAYRSGVPNADAASSVFTRNSELILLLTRLQWDAQGQPLVPGSLGVWQEAFARENKQRHSHDWARHVHAADSPESLLDTVVAYTNDPTNNGPSQLYLILSSIDSERPAGSRLSNDTARLLSTKYVELCDWYPIFVEFPELNDASISDFVATADRINGIQNQALRSNALGAFQAEVGIWQILARQRQIARRRSEFLVARHGSALSGSLVVDAALRRGAKIAQIHHGCRGHQV